MLEMAKEGARDWVDSGVSLTTLLRALLGVVSWACHHPTSGLMVSWALVDLVCVYRRVRKWGQALCWGR